MTKIQNVVGLFGTCGDSAWRNPVIERLNAEGIASFNPVVPDWTPECATIEAEHLATDKVLLFVVTGETEGYGSLAETGWAALSADRNDQTVILVIEDFPDRNPKSTANRARKLVREHAKKAGVKVYTNIGEALEATVTCIKS